MRQTCNCQSKSTLGFISFVYRGHRRRGVPPPAVSSEPAPPNVGSTRAYLGPCLILRTVPDECERLFVSSRRPAWFLIPSSHLQGQTMISRSRPHVNVKMIHIYKGGDNVFWLIGDTSPSTWTSVFRPRRRRPLSSSVPTTIQRQRWWRRCHSSLLWWQRLVLLEWRLVKTWSRRERHSFLSPARVPPSPTRLAWPPRPEIMLHVVFRIFFVFLIPHPPPAHRRLSTKRNVASPRVPLHICRSSTRSPLPFLLCTLLLLVVSLLHDSSRPNPMNAFSPGLLDLCTRTTTLGIARKRHRIAHHALWRPASNREMRKRSRKRRQRLVRS